MYNCLGLLVPLVPRVEGLLESINKTCSVIQENS